MSGTGALILAGGRSRRMGRDKATLVWRGRTLLERAQDLARAAGADPVLVSGRDDGLADPLPDLGPAGGVLALAEHWNRHLRTLPVRWLLLPVDMPALTTDDLAPLLEAPSPGAHFTHRPLPAVLHLDPERARVVQETVTAATTAQDDPQDDPQARRGRMLALHRLWRRIGIPALPLPAQARSRFVNLNTPGQWRGFLASHR